ncbi:MAG: glyoxalase [Chromatiales bacterium 21-64-14]|nr:MAG: glyoxalase [Chromatiales bacterium 21-64-14]HQU14474.1 VOC family protein [Gammaproteobacteria bacterium]
MTSKSSTPKAKDRGTRPAPTAGLRHVALMVADLAACERFYVELLGMRVEWRPDPDNVYLTSGADNLALHRPAGHFAPQGDQRLDHIGFLLRSPADVDAWHEFLVGRGVPVRSAPRTHRDGARSFYCQDPAGNLVQMIYHPPIAEDRA